MPGTMLPTWRSRPAVTAGCGWSPHALEVAIVHAVANAHGRLHGELLLGHHRGVRVEADAVVAELLEAPGRAPAPGRRCRSARRGRHDLARAQDRVDLVLQRQRRGQVAVEGTVIDVGREAEVACQHRDRGQHQVVVLRVRRHLDLPREEVAEDVEADVTARGRAAIRLVLEPGPGVLDALQQLRRRFHAIIERRIEAPAGRVAPCAIFTEPGLRISISS